MLITLFDIQNAEKLFCAVDQCVGPVTVTADDGSSEDIRNNTLIRKLLVEAGPHGRISQLMLHVGTPQDVKTMYRFMLES